jgi:biopolymer transport protein ExbB
MQEEILLALQDKLGVKMAEFFARLGFVAYPLAICSFLGLVLMIERLFFFVALPSLKKIECEPLQKNIQSGCPLKFFHKKVGEGFDLLLSHKEQPKEIRDEVTSYWLSEFKKKLFASLKALGLVATIAPMLGFLGTVMGMIDSFQAIASLKGPVYPALVAGGLWTALLTTAVGLIIAIPCLVANQIFRFWGEAYINRLSALLNIVSFTLSGISLKPNKVNHNYDQRYAKIS